MPSLQSSRNTLRSGLSWSRLRRKLMHTAPPKRWPTRFTRKVEPIRWHKLCPELQRERIVGRLSPRRAASMHKMRTIMRRRVLTRLSLRRLFTQSLSLFKFASVLSKSPAKLCYVRITNLSDPSNMVAPEFSCSCASHLQQFHDAMR